MLILSRKKSDAIYIGDDIRIYVVDIQGDKCRIGIDAPRDVPVYRQEVAEAIEREKRKEKEDAERIPTD